ncbi:hypothetical protein TNCV_524081 [Trichonephila clavipes]|nr:hypothetical protein TNCV_524081 [Trichonephila clavipes]
MIHEPSLKSDRSCFRAVLLEDMAALSYKSGGFLTSTSIRGCDEWLSLSTPRHLFAGAFIDFPPQRSASWFPF